MSSKINIDKLSLEVSKQLNAYKDVTVDIIEYAVKKTAQETVDEIRSNIDAAGIEGSGDYKKSWGHKKDASLRGKWRYAEVVYSKLYQLPHLLEYGHGKVNGGRVKAYPHISAAETIARKNLEFYIKSGVAQNKGG